jgi:galactokinase/mevalonate kinase-like predicted kinase
MVHASAPGRGGIIGNPSDIYGGTVVSCAITERAEAVVSESPRLIFDIYGHFQQIDGPEDLQFVPELHYLDVAKAIWRHLRQSDYASRGLLDPDATFHVRAQSSIPLKAGCAGSTAMLVVILAGILKHLNVPYERHELAELARRVERHELGVACGYQDHYMTIFGGCNCIDVRDKADHADHYEAPYATVEPLNHDLGRLPFILANTGLQRVSGKFHAEPRRQWENGDPRRVEGFRRIGQLGRLGKKALLSGDWAWLGELMNENHALTSELIGCGDQNAHLIGTALQHGALGAKLSGAGRGGTIIALHEDPDWIGARLLEAGAERLIRFFPGPGLTVRRI